MKAWLIRIATNACALAVAAWLFSGIKITGERAAGTGVCDRHRLTAMAGQPTPTFRGRLRLIAFARHDRSLPGPAHATYSLTDLVTRHVRGRRECTPVGWSRRLQDLPEGVN